MKKSKLLLAMATALVAMASTAHAATDASVNKVQSTNWAERWSDSWDSGVYVKGNVGHSNVRHLNSVDGLAVDNSDTSFGVAAGYQFNQFVGAELGYKNLGKFKTAFGDIKGDTWDLAVVGKYPVGYGFAATAKAGLAFTEAKAFGERSRNTTAVYGLGVEYALNKNTALITGWDRYHNFADSNHKLDNVSVGLKYRF